MKWSKIDKIVINFIEVCYFYRNLFHSSKKLLAYYTPVTHIPRKAFGTAFKGLFGTE